MTSAIATSDMIDPVLYCKGDWSHGGECCGICVVHRSDHSGAVSPWAAAHERIGANRTVKIVRYRLDGTRCGMVQGRHAEWNWAYRVEAPIAGTAQSFDMGRGLVDARRFAAQLGARVEETWPGGKTWLRGPNGGLRQVSQ